MLAAAADLDAVGLPWESSRLLGHAAIRTGVGETREEAVARCRERAGRLNFRLAPAPVR